jgi:glycosyltransferase involved in cell wall biosynthesis
MSMLDAAASGLPIVVSSSVGERARVDGNGAFYREGDVGNLEEVLEMMMDPDTRRRLGQAGRDKMVREFSWDAVAEKLERDYVGIAGDLLA